MKNEKLLNCIGDIDPAYVESAEETNNPHTIKIKKRFIIIAAAIAVVLLTGAGFSDYIGGWLSDNIQWGVENDTLFTSQIKDGVTMKTYTDSITNEFVFEFTGADNAAYIEKDNEIMIYAQKADNAVFTLRIHENILHGYDVQEELINSETGEIFASNPFDFIIVDDLSDIE